MKIIIPHSFIVGTDATDAAVCKSPVITTSIPCLLKVLKGGVASSVSMTGQVGSPEKLPKVRKNWNPAGPAVFVMTNATVLPKLTGAVPKSKTTGANEPVPAVRLTVELAVPITGRQKYPSGR